MEVARLPYFFEKMYKSIDICIHMVYNNNCKGHAPYNKQTGVRQ